MMDEWRVFTRLFLEEVYQAYFGLEFANLSPLDMIEDAALKDLLRVSFSSIEEKDFKKSLKFAKIAFQWAADAIWTFLPSEGFLESLSTSLVLREFKDLKKALKMLLDRSRQAEYHAALLSSGVSLIDYKRFESSTPSVEFSLTFKPWVQWRQTESDEETARWVHNFVVTTIVHWQILGLAPSVPDRFRERTQKLIEEDDATSA